MEDNKNSVFVKAHMKRMDEQLAMLFKKIREKEEREEWQLHEKNIELKELIGRGSVCNAHRGVYHNGEESLDVAVKVFEWGEERKETARIAASRKAFLQEISIWHKIEHPNIAKMIGAIYNKAGCYGEIERLENKGLVVMKYVPGGTLKTYIMEHLKRKLPFDVVMKLALGLARGLSYLHSQKIVHRNVKTENVLLDEKLNVKLTNFKVACFEPEDSKTDNNFHDFVLDVQTADSGSSCINAALDRCKLTGVTGTVGYMAPEVYNGPYDHKCDVYSFGICLWEIYCCDEPLSKHSLISNYERFTPRIPRCCPRSFGMVIAKCWETEPSRRPEMKEVVRLLEQIDVSKCKGMAPDESSSWLSCVLREWNIEGLKGG